MNIVDLIFKMLSGDAGKKLAASIGEGEGRTETAIKSAVPALLAALAGIASSPDGSQKLASAVEEADDSILGNLGGLLGGKGSGLADKGTSILGSLFSGGIPGKIGSVLGQFTGMDPGSMTTLLGALAPVILGLLKRETKSTGFDPAALSKLLQSQKGNIAAAMPSGLGGQLAGIPGLGNISSLLQGARDTVTTAATRAATAGSQAKAAAVEGAGALKWIVPLLAVLCLGLLAWKYWPAPQTTETAVKQTAQQATTVTALRVTDDTLQQASKATAGVTEFFSDATNTFRGVTDTASAEKAAQKMPNLIKRLGELKALIEAIPEPQRKTIEATIATSRGTLLTLIDKVMKIPGVSDALSPYVDKLRDALDDLTA
jgi:hypothetical protein